MTEDYKEKLIKYMTGNITDAKGLDTPSISSLKTIENNILDFVKENYPEYDKNYITISSLFTRNDYIVLWCTHFGDWTTGNLFIKSFIVVLDKNYNPIKYIDSYKSGTPLNNLISIDENDKGTGKIYGIDVVYENGIVSNRRVCVLNDFTLSNFEINQLSTFIIPKYNNYLVFPHQLIKSEEQAKYLMTYSIVDNQYNQIGEGALEFVNVVGGTNEWNFYPYDGNLTVRFNGFEKAYPIWDNDSLSFTIFTDYEKSLDSNNNSCGLVVLKQLATNEQKKTIVDKTISLPSECKNAGQMVSCARLYDDVLFETATTGSFPDTYYLIKMNLVNEKYILIENEESVSFPANFSHSYEPFLLNEQFYYYDMYSEYEYNGGNTSVVNRILFLKQIYNNQSYQLLNYEILDSNINLSSFYKNNTYNLNELGFIFNTQILQVKQVFNFNNYNGLPYEAPNCLVPNSSILYDTNDNIIFARNLYNKTVLGATTTSTVQIPNTMLNDVTIGKSDLISETDLPLTEDETNIIKNIYETVNINFANSISIRNDNDPNNTILNPTAAARLNGSATQNNNYNDVKATKVRVNYMDGTNMIIKLNPNVQIGALTDTVYQYNFILYVSKAINNLEIISNDELTSYQTIDNLTLEVGKTYNILQGVEIQ